KILPKGKEAAFASGLLLLYAAALFLSPDPEWTMWAAQMAIGVLYVPEAPTMQGIAPGEAVRVMSAAGTFGIFAAAALLALRRRKRHCERSHGTVSHAEVSWGQMGREGGEHDGRHPV
ncbi:MAG: hypothetical protein ACXW4J_10820, partial [Candidatus Deferrimicrobiaceae bacterium]